MRVLIDFAPCYGSVCCENSLELFGAMMDRGPPREIWAMQDGERTWVLAYHEKAWDWSRSTSESWRKAGLRKIRFTEEEYRDNERLEQLAITLWELIEALERANIGGIRCA